MDKFNLKEMNRTGHRSLDTEEEYEYEDLPLKGAAHVVAHLRLTETGCKVSGTYEAIIEEPCDRCSEPFERTVQDRFDERFIYEHYIDQYGGGERELALDDIYEVLGSDAQLDLKDLIHQHLVMKASIDRFCNGPDCQIQVSSEQLS